ncbi:HAD-like domain [Pseudocohnilembus persalinus]|uniref:HAD-like domain n=1 Tax=Pseudocohnilembus persalinus TaxID=266149 RepID=A0A0V0R0X2_PSEPJ|nr:HAD-like domain [Pseudocohnilembus persalinus]|eukprot:KRX07784.1 HAD-like domain [Pseudocohnilembus persalinus]
MKKSKKQRDLYVFKGYNITKMLFVFCDQQMKNWYNPDVRECKKRYFVNKNEDYEENYQPGQDQNFNFYINTAKNPTKHRFLVYYGQILSIKKRQYKKQLTLVVDLDDTLSRSYKHFMDLQENVKVFYPDYLILSAGTEIFDCSVFKDKENYTGLVRDETYQKQILQNFDYELVKKVFEANLPWIKSYKFDMENPRRVAYIPLASDVQKHYKEIEQVKQIMKQDYQSEVNVIISGNDVNLFMDIVSVKGNKGNGTIYCVTQMLNRDMNTTVSFGDSGNDIEMLQTTEQAYIVRNAQPSLKHWYQQLPPEQQKHVQISPMEYSYAWVFPNGFKIVQEGDTNYKKIEAYHKSDDEKLVMSVSDMNYFVLNDLKSQNKYYCSCGFQFEKILIPVTNLQQINFKITDQMKQNDNKFIQVYVPKIIAILSPIPCYIVQKQVLCQLLHVNKMKQNKSKDKIIEVQKDGNNYAVEESKLTNFYLQTIFKQCVLKNENYIIEIIFQNNCNQISNLSTTNQHSLQNTSIHASIQYQNNNQNQQIQNKDINNKNDKNNNQDDEDIWFSYCIRNNEYKHMHNILNPSNNAFDAVIFNQSPYHLYKLQLYMLLEYQIIFISRRTAYLTIFASNMIELLRPFTWRGVFIPFLIKNTFDYEYTSLPYIVGLDKNMFKIPQIFRPDIQKRVIYDLDENKFVLTTKDPECPRMYQNFLISKINEEIAWLKFWEEDYFEMGVVKFRQAFYNFNLLLFHDLLHYFSATKHRKNIQQGRSNTQKENSSIKISKVQRSSLNGLNQNSGQINRQLNRQNSKKSNNSKTMIKEDKTKQNNKKIAYFNFKAYLNSANEEDRPFYEVVIKTQIFNQFIKECFKAIDYKEQYINSMKKKQLEYTFQGVFQFIKDVRQYSMIKNQKDQSLEEKFQVIEKLQQKYIDDIENNEAFPVQKINIFQYLPDYLEKIQRHDSNMMSLSCDRENYEQGQKGSDIQNEKENDQDDKESNFIESDSAQKLYIKQEIKHLILENKKYALQRRLEDDLRYEEYMNLKVKQSQNQNDQTLSTNALEQNQNQYQNQYFNSETVLQKNQNDYSQFSQFSKQRENLNNTQNNQQNQSYFNQVQTENQSIQNLNQYGSNNNTNNNYNQNQNSNNNSISNNNNQFIREKSDKASTVFEIHSTYSNNFGFYLPMRRQTYQQINSSRSPEFTMSFQNRIPFHNRSFNSLWANIGEISESVQEQLVDSQEILPRTFRELNKQ